MHIVKIGPYLSAILPKVIWGGCYPLKRWRWPIKGHAPPASGGAVLLLAVLLSLLDNHGRKKGNMKRANMMAIESCEEWVQEEHVGL